MYYQYLIRTWSVLNADYFIAVFLVVVVFCWDYFCMIFFFFGRFVHDDGLRCCSSAVCTTASTSTRKRKDLWVVI